MRLEDKVCLITGAGSRIGQVTARLFAKEGGRVVVADQTVAEIRGTGGEAVPEYVDVTDEGQTQAGRRSQRQFYFLVCPRGSPRDQDLAWIEY